MARADAHAGPLTFEQAQQLRGEGLTLSEIGKRFGVSRQYVHKLLSRGPQARKRTATSGKMKARHESTLPSTPAVNQLTPRERTFAKGLLAGKTQKAAALEAAPEGSITAGSAEQWASRTVRKPKFRRGLREILEEAGLTEEAIARVHGENLYAQKVIGWTEDEEGRKVPIEYPDYRVRQRAVDSAWRVFGHEGVPREPEPARALRLTKQELDRFRAFASEETLTKMVAEQTFEIISEEEGASDLALETQPIEAVSDEG